MKSYNLKRVRITEINKSKLRQDKSFFQRLTEMQLRMAALPRPLDKTSRAFKEIQNCIRECREGLSEPRFQEIIYEVYVKQYNQTVVVEYTTQQLPPGPQYIALIKKMLKEVTQQGIQQARLNLKEGQPPSKFGKFYAAFDGKKKNGRVFKESGEVLRMYVEKNLKSLYDDKIPVEPKKYIGIELEFCAPIKQNEFAIKLFHKGIHKYAQLKKDGSLRPKEEEGENGYELAILLEETNYKKRLKEIINTLKEVGAVAQDRRAGLHVHIDMRKRKRDLVYSNLVACQHALLSIVDPKRHDNEFCRTVRSRKFPTEFTGERTERYKTINAAAFYKYKTLEVRMHEGSVDYVQITNWVDLLIKIANYNKKLKSSVYKISSLKKRIALNKKLHDYIQDRSCYWQVRGERRNERLQTLVAEMRDGLAPRPVSLRYSTTESDEANDTN
jgi:hypothetical protein